MDNKKTEIEGLTLEQLTFIGVGVFIMSKVNGLSPDHAIELVSRSMAMALNQDCPIDALTRICSHVIEQANLIPEILSKDTVLH